MIDYIFGNMYYTWIVIGLGVVVPFIVWQILWYKYEFVKTVSFAFLLSIFLTPLGGLIYVLAFYYMKAQAQKERRGTI